MTTADRKVQTSMGTCGEVRGNPTASGAAGETISASDGPWVPLARALTWVAREMAGTGEVAPMGVGTRAHEVDLVSREPGAVHPCERAVLRIITEELELAKKGDDDKDPTSPESVSAFLKGLGLSHFLQLFNKDGFDDWDDFLKVTDEDMQKIGIAKSEDRRKILVAIERL